MRYGESFLLINRFPHSQWQCLMKNNWVAFPLEQLPLWGRSQGEGTKDGGTVSSQGGPGWRVKALRMPQDVTDMGSFLKPRLPPLCMKSHTMLTVHENLLYLMEICWLPSWNVGKSGQTSCVYCFLFVKWRKCPTVLRSYTTLLPCYLAERWGRGTAANLSFQDKCVFSD